MTSRFYLAVVIALAISGCSISNSRKNATGTANEALPSFSIANSKGQITNLESYKGRKVMVNLWASWCPPCRSEMSSIEQLYTSIDTNKAVIILLSLDEEKEKAYSFMKGRAVSQLLFFPAEKLPDLFNVSGILTTFFFNENGLLVKYIEGGTDYNTDAFRTMLK